MNVHSQFPLVRKKNQYLLVALRKRELKRLLLSNKFDKLIAPRKSKLNKNINNGNASTSLKSSIIDSDSSKEIDDGNLTDSTNRPCNIREDAKKKREYKNAEDHHKKMQRKMPSIHLKE